MKHIVIVDLDGTLYDHVGSGRIDFMRRGAYDEYHSSSIHDDPHPEIVQLVNILSKTNIVIAISGREEKFRNITNDWLFEKEVLVESVWLRPTGDYRKDGVLKQDLLDQALEFHEATRENILFSIDDRDSSVQAWRESGIPTLQCRPDGA